MAPKTTTRIKKQLPKETIQEILLSLDNIDGWGSVEVIIQDYKVTQITEKNIKKTRLLVQDDRL